LAHFEEGFNFRQVVLLVFKKFGQVSETCHHLMLKISWGHSLTMLQQKIEEIKTTPYLKNGSFNYISPHPQEKKGGPFTPLLNFSLVAWKFYS
jgi:hypothetical protein